MRNLLRILIPAVIILTPGSNAWARSYYVDQIPNGTVNECANCHINPGGGGPRNAFGTLVERSFLVGEYQDVAWQPLLAYLDADDDGVSNGQELQDPYGVWTTHDPDPGDPILVTLPGDEASYHLGTLTLEFTGMTPHVGQKFEVRAVNKSNRREADRVTIASIPGADFSVTMDILLDGQSYWIDFYADLNGNGLYDSPPVDHAWQIELDDTQGDTTLAFEHNVNFTDIDWTYLFTLDLTSMTPHVGQQFELRVTDDGNGEEIGRERIQAIPDPAFSVSVPGIRVGRSYTIDFYADHNGNGLYDTPPTDHAWRLSATDNTGDVTLDFTHDTSFTDIGWGYLFVMQLMEMTPHVGQLFELRVVNESDETEIGRIRVEEIALADLSVSVPGILPGGNYRADFYADYNQNGVYDVPPTDHAWRVLFPDSTGDVVTNFTHNTNFTDIEWPAVGIGPSGPTVTPRAFVLRQNFPNPFNPSTTISFTVPEIADETRTRVSIYDVRGRRVRVLLDRVMVPGSYQLNWDGRDDKGLRMPSGTYLLRLQSGKDVSTRKMIMTK